VKVLQWLQVVGILTIRTLSLAELQYTMSGTVSPKANYERILAKAVREILPFTLDIRFFRNQLQK
jgi:hypothetical protein